MSRFQTHIPLPSRYSNESNDASIPTYRQPVLLATYSHTADRSIVPTDESMTYYRPAPIGSDLTYGLENRIERDPTLEEHLDGLCDAIQRMEIDRGRGELRRGSIVTWRGMLTRIMTAPYEDREGWEMDILALDGSVYMEQFEPAHVKAQRAKEQSSWALQTYMGYAFESYSTTQGEVESQEDEPEGWSGVVNTNIQYLETNIAYISVIRSAIDNVPVFLGGEVDCVIATPGDPHPGLDHCVELKTNRVIQNEKQDFIFHKKLLKHWAQSFLLGIEHIQIGFRDDQGILKSQRSFSTSTIPALVATSPSKDTWTPKPCLNFLHDTLQTILTTVLPLDPTTTQDSIVGETLPTAIVWRLKFTPRRGCDLYCLGEVETTKGRWGGILPEKYVWWKVSHRLKPHSYQTSTYQHL